MKSWTHLIEILGECNMTKGTPKKDGSGQGRRTNQGRGGCKPTKPRGKGKQIRGGHHIVYKIIWQVEILAILI